MNNLLQQAITYHQQKNWAEAKRLYEYLLKADPKNFDALLLLGLLSAECGDADLAIGYLQKAVKVNPSSEAASFNLAVAHMGKGDWGWAEKAFLQAVKINPGNLKAYAELAKLQTLMKKPQNAIQYFEKAIQLDPKNPEILNDYGVLQGTLKRYELAIEAFQKAIQLNPNYIDGLANLGKAYLDTGDFENSQYFYRLTLTKDPKMQAALLGLGHALRGLGKNLDAMLSYDKVLEFDPNCVMALVNKGQLWTIANNLDEARLAFSRAYELDPTFRFLYGGLVFVRLRQCDWAGVEESIRDVETRVVDDGVEMEPFIALAIYDSLKTQKYFSESFGGARFNYQQIHYSKAIKNPSKLVVAYLSADFKNHPISFLMAELFEIHNRDQFEIVGVSFTHIRDEMHKRVSSSFDKYVDASGKSDKEVLGLLKGMNIDIAIDLGGYTSDSRFEYFARRIAPVQMSYLGYLGTTGLNCIDYIIADEEIIPPESQQFYSEKVAYLPSYQVNDRKRKASERIFTKEEFGIPENAFVYCCFNNNYKLMPEVFSSWMKILGRVQNSVLLLYAENETVKENLKKEALARGIDPTRLFFGERLSQADYLARYRVADLFLDTFPYNAGTTASDALWMDVPVLTRQGETFASRVASSILKSVDLPELITKTVEEYESLACDLGSDPERVKELRNRLAANKQSKPLFDTPTFTKNLERLYEIAFKKYQDGEKPSNIHVN